MNSLAPSPAAALSPGLAVTAAIPGKTAKAAGQFEALLLTSLLESMEKTFAAVPGEETVVGSDDYNYLGCRALAEALAARGGFGIGAVIARHLPAHEGKG
jgi:Rod binding domain-containing protein